ncbi:unnamed protein product [Trifolium pratense]|uniref:Uncharacterized protein n=1 Tax=Trifolium pratense TaxID=57577 RepID=A0ACB0KMB6_TRIPR|nr:unnamed protein product [Trifolium pratense]
MSVPSHILYADDIMLFCSISQKSSIVLMLSGTTETKEDLKITRLITTLQAFHVKFKYANAPVIKEVLWQPPVFNWIKCNCDGSSIGISSSLHDELIGAMTAVEIAHSKGWINLWIETDSMLVVLAFKSSKVVRWTLRNRWDNCLYLLSSMSLLVTHIYREGNHCADKLANLGLSLHSKAWWTVFTFSN